MIEIEILPNMIRVFSCLLNLNLSLLFRGSSFQTVGLAKLKVSITFNLNSLDICNSNINQYTECTIELNELEYISFLPLKHRAILFYQLARLSEK